MSIPTMPMQITTMNAEPYNRTAAEKIFNALNEPFDPSDIKWKPQTVNYKTNMALAVAHADPRAYIDRLNEVLGTGGWNTQFDFVVTPYIKTIKGKAAWGSKPATEDKTYAGNKVLCICTLHIPGVGTHSSTGDADASDDNAATSAEAQAFKRACMQFGLGRYLYDLPKQNIRYENFEFQQTPTLPDWAIPKIPCEKCAKNITEVTIDDKTFTATAIINNSLKKYNGKYCSDCQREMNQSKSAAERKK